MASIDIATEDFEVVRGNNPTIQITFMDGASPFDLTGSSLVLRVVNGTSEKIRRAMTLAGDPTTGVATIVLTSAETRSLPKDVACDYEVERRIGGDEETILVGSMTGVYGANDEVA